MHHHRHSRTALWFLFLCCCTFVLCKHDLPVVLVFGVLLPLSNNRTIAPSPNPWLQSFDVNSFLNDHNAHYLIRTLSPDCIVSFGDVENFLVLSTLPLELRARWIHFDKKRRDLERADSEFWASLSLSVEQNIFDYWAPEPQYRRSTDRGNEWQGPGRGGGGAASLLQAPSDNPLICLFSPSYHGHKYSKLNRVFDSLRNQTYDNWEWVVVVDDPDDRQTVALLEGLAQQDARLSFWVPPSHSGVIGTRKRQAAMLCRGDILVEMDHDDQLFDTTLYHLAIAFASAPPDVGFLYTDFAEPFYLSKLTEFANYGDSFPLHYETFQTGAPLSPSLPRYFLATRTRALTLPHLSHLVNMPNHIRAWRAPLYRALGGHRDVPVGDDYELLLRTFLATRWLYWDRLEYLQYRNPGGDNFTFRRNEFIQWVVYWIHQRYYKRLALRAQELGPGPLHIPWGFAFDQSPRVALLLAVPSARALTRSMPRLIGSLVAQSYRDVEIVVLCLGFDGRRFFPPFVLDRETDQSANNYLDYEHDYSLTDEQKQAKRHQLAARKQERVSAADPIMSSSTSSSSSSSSVSGVGRGNHLYSHLEGFKEWAQKNISINFYQLPKKRYHSVELALERGVELSRSPYIAMLVATENGRGITLKPAHVATAVAQLKPYTSSVATPHLACDKQMEGGWRLDRTALVFKREYYWLSSEFRSALFPAANGSPGSSAPPLLSFFQRKQHERTRDIAWLDECTVGLVDEHGQPWSGGGDNNGAAAQSPSLLRTRRSAAEQPQLQFGSAIDAVFGPRIGRLITGLVAMLTRHWLAWLCLLSVLLNGAAGVALARAQQREVQLSSVSSLLNDFFTPSGTAPVTKKKARINKQN